MQSIVFLTTCASVQPNAMNDKPPRDTALAAWGTVPSSMGHGAGVSPSAKGRSKGLPGIPSPAAAAVSSRNAPESLTAVQLLLSGAVAGSLGKSATAPVDRVKILFQVSWSAVLRCCLTLVLLLLLLLLPHLVACTVSPHPLAKSACQL